MNFVLRPKSSIRKSGGIRLRTCDGMWSRDVLACVYDYVDSRSLLLEPEFHKILRMMDVALEYLQDTRGRVVYTDDHERYFGLVLDAFLAKLRILRISRELADNNILDWWSEEANQELQEILMCIAGLDPKWIRNSLSKIKRHRSREVEETFWKQFGKTGLFLKQFWEAMDS